VSGNAGQAGSTLKILGLMWKRGWGRRLAGKIGPGNPENILKIPVDSGLQLS